MKTLLSYIIKEGMVEDIWAKEPYELGPFTQSHYGKGYTAQQSNKPSFNNEVSVKIAAEIDKVWKEIDKELFEATKALNNIDANLKSWNTSHVKYILFEWYFHTAEDENSKFYSKLNYQNRKHHHRDVLTLIISKNKIKKILGIEVKEFKSLLNNAIKEIGLSYNYDAFDDMEINLRPGVDDIQKIGDIFSEKFSSRKYDYSNLQKLFIKFNELINKWEKSVGF